CFPDDHAACLCFFYVTCVVSGTEAEVKRGEARAAHLSTGEEKTEERKERGGKQQRMNNPIPSNLKSEAKKAAKILRDFTEISNRTGLTDRLIPAEGLAIISVIKAGFMITARGGSGIVIARLGDRRVGPGDHPESAPGRGRVHEGGEPDAGGNCTVAVGPIGRNVEADVSIRSPAAVFTYCRSRGLFAGISLEGSGLIERKDTNRKFYGREIRASAILNGDVEPPPECYDLYHILDEYTDAYTADWTSKNMRPKVHLSKDRHPDTNNNNQPDTNNQEDTNNNNQPDSNNNNHHQDTNNSQSDTNNNNRPDTNNNNQEDTNNRPDTNNNNNRPDTNNNNHQPDTTNNNNQPDTNNNNNNQLHTSRLQPPRIKTPCQLASRNPPNNGGGGASGELVVTATHPFTGQQPGDLSFVPGDSITVVTKTESQYDWWEGRHSDGRVGIFPANFVAF
ncbi:hypothetical protein F7725_008825, partial [Dissostichus mawsoni]